MGRITVRRISAPINPIKIIQQKLNYILSFVYQPRATVHGFVNKRSEANEVLGRSIVTNAKLHVKQNYILNIDLKDFFPSINFGRVRGLFMATPYNLPEEVATVLAQICCYQNQLPQGAPTSPIISNMICARMDSQIFRLAIQHQCRYTRYADDITLSTFKSNFPASIANIVKLQTGQQLEVGTVLLEIIRQNGFNVNFDKLRLQNKYQHQEVTGLTVNEKTNVTRAYIRQLRAMLHAWEKYGIEAAENEYLTRYRKKSRSHYKDDKNSLSFAEVVRGKIEFVKNVRGSTDAIYLKLQKKYKYLVNPDFVEGVSMPAKLSKLFLSHASEDKTQVELIYERLKAQGFNPWMDSRDIDGGEIWNNAITRALKDCDLFLLFLSKRSINKRGYLQQEIKKALDLWQGYFEDDIYIIPLRLEECSIPDSVSHIQCIDFYKADGWERLIRSIDRASANRNRN